MFLICAYDSGTFRGAPKDSPKAKKSVFMDGRLEDWSKLWRPCWGHELHCTRETTWPCLTMLDPFRDFRAARFAASTCRASRFKSKVTRKVRLAACPLARRWSKQPRPAPCGGNGDGGAVVWWWWVDMQRLRKFKRCMTVWPCMTCKADIFRLLLYAAGSTGAFCLHSWQESPP